MQTKASIILNEIFKYLIIFLLIFAWLNFYYPNFIASIIISVIITSIICFILSKFFYSKKDKIYSTSKDKKQAKDCSTQLIFSDLSDNLSFFTKIFNKKNISVKPADLYLILYPDTSHSILFFPYFSTEEINESIIINVYKQLKNLNVNKALICGAKFSSSSRNLAASLDNIQIVLFDDEATYMNLLKPADIYPEKKTAFKSSKKMNFQLFLRLLLNKKNYKHYFFGAIMLLFASLFIRLSNYYLIFSSILFILSLLSFYSDKIFNKDNKIKFDNTPVTK